MDFAGAIQAHAAWKLKLKTYMNHPDGSLKAGDIEPTLRCELGKWLEEQSHHPDQLKKINELRTAHARFHTAAAQVVRKADSGARVAEDMALGSKSEFGAASAHIVQLLMALSH